MAFDLKEEGGAYQQAISVLYAVAYTLKMSYKTDYKIEGFFEYVVPPLEGFWWQDDVEGVDYTNKSAFNWISVIRLSDFISKADFEWAVETAKKKKKLDCSSEEYLTIDEGLCGLYWNQMLCERLAGRTGILLRTDRAIEQQVYMHQ